LMHIKGELKEMSCGRDLSKIQTYGNAL